MPELGLFPLPLVLMPTERIPLRIFEPRYRELIGECIETGGDFGFVLATGDGAVHEVGTRASVAQVLDLIEPEEDALNIVVEGGERFRLLELTAGRSFTTGSVEPIEDDGDAPDEAAAVRALELFNELAETSDSPVDVPAGDSPQLDFELAARVDFGVEPRQELLASTSPRRRMERLIELLETALESVRLEQTLRDRAGRNGKVMPLDPDITT